ncbi:PKD domain-containing protein [Marivirga harenae]|uniref:PKD domain-containing protein n=1 Tax=Marivirga harenae TaxID=2010992 RepID=UPI0026E04676|nr:hypothetical protein [Marivirga harenae]WKV12892.1 hypothetical protein Q3Y49_03495 [Marivirga harenae]
MVTLMGGGEIGDDLEVFLQNNSNRSPAWAIDRGEWPQQYPFVVLTPQLPRDLEIENPNDQRWSTGLINEVINHVINTYNIDEDRLYLTGVSLGATGCWDFAAEFPQKVAAMIPISGPSDDSLACILKDIPIWAMHGENDGLVDPFINSTGEMVDSINNCNGQYKAEFELIPSRGHDIWNDIYPESMGLSIYEWLLNFEKGQTNNIKPYVGLGPDLKLLMPEDYINIYGFAFDVDGTIMNYSWEIINPVSAEIVVIDNNNVKIYPSAEGIHQLRLTVTDNESAIQSDTMEIEFFDEIPVGLNFMTGLMLQDGSTNTDLIPLGNEDNIINLFTLGTEDINILAIDDGVCNSFRFAINGYQNIRTENRQSVGLLLSRRRNPPEWNVSPGNYIISATPFSGNKNNLGTAGISVINKLQVFDQEPQTYQLIPETDIGLTQNWLNSGDATNPDSFQENFQNFIINDSAYLNQAILEKGVVSSIRLGTGSYLTLNDSLAIPLILDSASILQINNPNNVSFQEIHPNSLIIYNTTGYLDLSTVGNLEVKASNILNLKKDSVAVNKLTIGDGASIQNSSQNLTLNINDDLIIEGNNDFTPSSPFSIVFNSNKNHQLIFDTNILNFNSIELLGQDTLEFNHSTKYELNLSRINLSESSLLSLANCELAITGNNVLSENLSNGKIKFGNQSNLLINANPTQDLFLNLEENGNILKNLTFNITNASKIIVSDSLKIYGRIEAENGTLASGGYLQFLATDSMTAYIINDLGTVEGEVQIEKLISEGKVFRYLSSSATDFSVEEFQQFIPVTGAFTGASTGPELGNDPSIFSYDSNNEIWIPFPSSTNQETFETGRGYAIYFRNETIPTKIKWMGPLIQSDFNYTITGNDDIGNQQAGWNLIANPYATPILWGDTGWTSLGLSNTASIADNTVAGGRFLVWDGEIGDPEFSGIISQNQAFWVRSVTETASLNVSEAAKLEESNASTFRNVKSSYSGLVITLSNQELLDRLYLKISDIGSVEYLPDIDAVKRSNAYFNLFYPQEINIRLAIKNLPDNQCFSNKLGIEGIESGNYSLKFKKVSKELTNGDLFFYDYLLDSSILITNNLQYDFSFDTNDSISLSERFDLKYELSTPIPEISIIGDKLIANYEENIQWFRDSTLIENETDATLIPNQSGSYFFQAESNSCLVSSASIYYVLTANRSIETDISIFPNPVRDNKLIVQLPEKNRGIFELSLINPEGKEIMRNDAINFNETNAELYLPEDLNNGTYILMLSRKHKFYQLKIILDR